VPIGVAVQAWILGHVDVRSGEWREASGNADSLVGVAALAAEFQLVVLASIDRIEPVLRKRGKLQGRLRIYLATAEQYREGGEVCFGLGHGLEVGDYKRSVKEPGRRSRASLGVEIRSEDVGCGDTMVGVFRCCYDFRKCNERVLVASGFYLIKDLLRSSIPRSFGASGWIGDDSRLKCHFIIVYKVTE
jgi:hypothetical protein